MVTRNLYAIVTSDEALTKEEVHELITKVEQLQIGNKETHIKVKFTMDLPD